MKSNIFIAFGLFALMASIPAYAQPSSGAGDKTLQGLTKERRELALRLKRIDDQDRSLDWTYIDERTKEAWILGRVKARAKVERSLDEVKRMIAVLQGKAANLGDDLPDGEALLGSFNAVMRDFSKSGQLPETNDPRYAEEYKKHWQALIGENQARQGRAPHPNALE